VQGLARVMLAWYLRRRSFELDTAPRPHNVEFTIGAEVAAPMPGVVIATQA